MRFEEIEIRQGAVAARVAPERGGLVTALEVEGRPVLFLDRASFEDETKNVRGGVPILFPFAGKLEGDRFEPAGTLIKQHGFARNKAWAVGVREAGRLALRLASDHETLETYPYPFELEQVCTLLERGLEIELRVRNTGERPMPVAPGWHPYFPCAGGQKTQIKTALVGIDPTLFDNGREFEYGTEPPAEGRAEFEMPGLGRLAIGVSPELRHLHFWSQPGRDFICIEPFTGDLGAVNRPADRVEVAAGQTQSFRMSMELG